MADKYLSNAENERKRKRVKDAIKEAMGIVDFYEKDPRPYWMKGGWGGAKDAEELKRNQEAIKKKQKQKARNLTAEYILKWGKHPDKD